MASDATQQNAKGVGTASGLDAPLRLAVKIRAGICPSVAWPCSERRTSVVNGHGDETGGLEFYLLYWPTFLPR